MFSYLRNPRLIAFVGLLILAAILGVMANRAMSEGRSIPLEDAARIVLRPFQAAFAGIGSATRGTLRSLRTRSSLLKENEALRAEVRRLTMEDSRLREAAEESVRLRHALDFRASFSLRLASARVIGREASGWFATCVIDRGTRDGVRPGYAVTTFRGLVGQVLKASPTSSTVLMLSDASSSIGALDQRSRVNGICQGQDSETLSLNYLPKEADVKIGDIVVSSGIGGLIPKGLPIGRVIGVEADRGGFLKHALVRPSARFEQLEEVFVVIRAVEE